ncbi:MAK10-like protein [Tanacetum coccineum]
MIYSGSVMEFLFALLHSPSTQLESYSTRSTCSLLGRDQQAPFSVEKTLEDIHVTWTQFGKKRDKIAALREVASNNRIQFLETVSQFLATPSEPTRDGVKKFMTASEPSAKITRDNYHGEHYYHGEQYYHGELYYYPKLMNHIRGIKEILRDITQRDIKDILGDITQRDIKEILGDITQRDIKEILGDITQRDIKEILGDITQRDIKEILGDITQRDIKEILGDKVTT